MLAFLAPLPLLPNPRASSALRHRPLRSSPSLPRQSRARLTATAATPQSPPRAPASVHNANVVIVGGGPCGAFAAAQLNRRGVACTLVEKINDFSDFNPTRSFHQVVFYRGRKVLATIPGLLDYLAPWAAPMDTFKATVWTADKALRNIERELLPCDGNPELRFLRSDLSKALSDFVQGRCNAVTTMYGTVVEAIEFGEDGAMELRLDTDGRKHSLTTKLVLACDGRNSTVINEILREEKESSHISSSKGSGLTTLGSPAVGMNIKGVVVKENFTELLTPPAPIEESEGGNRVLVGAKKNRPRNAVFSLIVFPLVPGAVKTLGGFLGLSANLPNHELWKAQTVEEGYRLFEDNFPQAKIRECISEEQMATFVQTRPSVFCPITRRDSLAFRVGEPAQGGVLVMGDAAHSFPPDLGQGVNSAFEDVAVFTDLLDGFSNDTSLDTVLKEYEARRDADTTALTKIAQVAAPYQYGQNKLGSMLSAFNRNGRDKLTKLLPNFFYPAMIELVYSDIPYSCILSRTNATTLRIWLLAASLVVGPLASVLFLSGLAQ